MERPDIYDSKVECSSPIRLPQSDSHGHGGDQSSEAINVFLAPDDALGGPRPAMPLNSLDDAIGSSRPGYRLVEGVVDSGASKSTGPKRIFRGRLRPSLMSKKGLKFQGPDGTEIPNYGELDIDWESMEGHKCKMCIQISDVDRILLAVTELNDAGNDVVLSKSGGEIVNVATGKKDRATATWRCLHRQNVDTLR